MNIIELYKSDSALGTLFRWIVNIGTFLLFAYIALSFSESISQKMQIERLSTESANFRQF